MEKLIACCGKSCSTCPSHGTHCKGCTITSGEPCWAAQVNLKTCYFYSCCVLDKQLQHCGECNELPCPLFYALQEPSISEKEHFQNVEDRVARLREYARMKKPLHIAGFPMVQTL